MSLSGMPLFLLISIPSFALGAVACLIYWLSKDDPQRRAAADAIGYAPSDIRWDAKAGKWVPKPGREPQRIGVSHPFEPRPVGVPNIPEVPPPPPPPDPAHPALAAALEACAVKHNALWEVAEAIRPLHLTVSEAIAACPQEEPAHEPQEAPREA